MQHYRSLVLKECLNTGFCSFFFSLVTFCRCQHLENQIKGWQLLGGVGCYRDYATDTSIKICKWNYTFGLNSLLRWITCYHYSSAYCYSCWSIAHCCAYPQLPDDRELQDCLRPLETERSSLFWWLTSKEAIPFKVLANKMQQPNLLKGLVKVLSEKRQLYISS